MCQTTLHYSLYHHRQRVTAYVSTNILNNIFFVFRKQRRLYRFSVKRWCKMTRYCLLKQFFVHYFREERLFQCTATINGRQKRFPQVQQCGLPDPCKFHPHSFFFLARGFTPLGNAELMAWIKLDVNNLTASALCSSTFTTDLLIIATVLELLIRSSFSPGSNSITASNWSMALQLLLLQKK